MSLMQAMPTLGAEVAPLLSNQLLQAEAGLTATAALAASLAATLPPVAAIRAAGPQHLPEMRAIFNEIVATSTAVYTDLPETLAQRQDWFEQRQALGYPVLVALAPGSEAVLGFASFTDFRGCWPGFRHTAEHSVHIRADQRGQGLGRRLLVALLDEARRCGKHAMMASIDADNAPSIRLHQSLGFVQVGHLPQVGCKFGRWLDLALLQKVLDTAPPG